jgi:hypothetical protein
MKQLVDRGISSKKMRELVKIFIKNCPICQKMRLVHQCIRAHSFTLASFEPWELANIDSIGPLPPDENGNIYIIVIVCCFTRWVELYPVKEADKVLFTHCGRFSYPSTVLNS